VKLVNRLAEPTNLHVHGLHVSPEGHGNNVFVAVQPGESFDYDYRLPDDHPPGVYWDQSHHHSLVADPARPRRWPPACRGCHCAGSCGSRCARAGRRRFARSPPRRSMPAASWAAAGASARRRRRAQCGAQLEQGRLVQGHRVPCPSARTIGVVSLTITRRPLARDHPRGRDLDQHHQRGRHPLPVRGTLRTSKRTSAQVRRKPRASRAAEATRSATASAACSPGSRAVTCGGPEGQRRACRSCGRTAEGRARSAPDQPAPTWWRPAECGARRTSSGPGVFRFGLRSFGDHCECAGPRRVGPRVTMTRRKGFDAARCGRYIQSLAGEQLTTREDAADNTVRISVAARPDC
jgi:Multicopper oxidase